MRDAVLESSVCNLPIAGDRSERNNKVLKLNGALVIQYWINAHGSNTVQDQCTS